MGRRGSWPPRGLLTARRPVFPVRRWLGGLSVVLNGHICFAASCAATDHQVVAVGNDTLTGGDSTMLAAPSHKPIANLTERR